MCFCVMHGCEFFRAPFLYGTYARTLCSCMFAVHLMSAGRSRMWRSATSHDVTRPDGQSVALAGRWSCRPADVQAGAWLQSDGVASHRKCPATRSTACPIPVVSVDTGRNVTYCYTCLHQFVGLQFVIHLADSKWVSYLIKFYLNVRKIWWTCCCI
jgi:hypothetical protein